MASPLLTNLVSYWKLNESSGNAADSIGSNTLVNTDSVTYAAALIGNGASMNGGPYLTITDASQSGLDITGDISTSFWIKLASEPGTDNGYEMVTKWGSGSGAYRFIYRDAGGQAQMYAALYAAGDPGTNVNYAKNISHIGTSAFNHFVFTFKASTGTMTFYLNGASLGTVVDTSVTTINNSTGNFSIGTLGVGVQGFFNGIVDEVALYNSELTSGNVASLFNTGLGTTPPFNTTYTLTAAQGSFTLTGQSITFRLMHTLTAAVGSFVLSGQAALFPITRKLTAATGSFVLTGIAASLRVVTATAVRIWRFPDFISSKPSPGSGDRPYIRPDEKRKKSKWDRR